MAKEQETYEGLPVVEAATSYILNDATRYSWSGNKPPYAVRIPDGRATVKAGAFSENDEVGIVKSESIIGRVLP